MNFYWFVLLAWCGIIIGIAIGDVGTIPVCDNTPYNWWLPITIAGLIIFPAMLGYIIGKEE